MAGEITETGKKDLGTFYNLRAVAYYHLKQFKEARQNLEKAVSLDPQNIEILRNLAEILVVEKNLDQAAEYYSLALKISPENKDLKMRLAKTYAHQKKFDAAYELDKNNEDILNVIFGEIFKFEGQCVRCGACCKNMVLVYKSKLINTEEEFKKICQESPDFQRWQPFRDSTGRLRFNCSKLNQEGLCLDYEKRQTLCRAYPNFMTTGLKEGCGFKRKVDFDFPAIKNISLINAIARHAMKMELYDEALKILKIDSAEVDVKNLARVFKESLEETKINSQKNSA